MMTFDLTNFIGDLRDAATTDTPLPRLCAVLERAIAAPDSIEANLPALDEDEALLFEDDALSIWRCVYAPGHTIPPHDHQMSAIIGLYEGSERNDFYQADPKGGVRKSSEVVLEAGETLSIGPSAIHAVACVSDAPCKGFHVYLGNLTATQRSLFDVDGRRALPFTPDNYAALKS